VIKESSNIHLLFSFGHELGHNFGALHNPKEYKDKNIAIIGDKYGHLIQDLQIFLW